MIKKYSLLCLILFIIPLSVGIWTILYTTPGGVVAVRLALTRYGLSNNFEVKGAHGNLSQGLILDNCEFVDIAQLPKGAIIYLQKFGIRLTALSLKGISIEEVNGRLKLPEFEEPIFIFGSYLGGIVDLNVYAKHVDVSELMKEMSLPLLKKLSGGIDEIDLYIKGESSRFNVTGAFKIERLSYQNSFLSDAQGFIDLEVTDVEKDPKVSGRVEFKDGMISGPRMATIQVTSGVLQFSGDPVNPVLNIQGSSKVDQTVIKIILKGTAEKPDLFLSSIPPASQEWLLIMLGTGRSWGGVNESITNKKLSPDITRDFIDYMIFGGSGSRMAHALGIKEWSILFDEQSQGLQFKKAISERISAIYAVEQARTAAGQQPTESTQTFGGEYQVTDQVSVGAERKITQSDGTSTVNGSSLPQQEDAQIMLKYKKSF